MPSAGPPPVQDRSVATVNSRANAAQQNYLTIVDTLKANSGAEAKAIRAMFGGDKKLADKFLAVAFSLIASDSDLLFRATPMSVVEAIKKAASLGLEPMTDEAGITVYGDKATLLPMYKGYLKRIRNSGLVRAVDASMVYSEDEFDYGTNQDGWWHNHHPMKVLRDSETGERINSRGKYQGAFAFAVMNNGYRYGRYMDVDELNAIRDQYGQVQSKSGRPMPWQTAYEQMCLKTVVRRLVKMLPQEAVGREMLEVEQVNDEATERLTAEIRRTNDDMAEVRQLALRAVGQIPPGEEPPSDPPGASATPEVDNPEAEPELTQQAEVPEPAVVDPNVAAAMKLNEEQLRRQRGR